MVALRHARVTLGLLGGLLVVPLGAPADDDAAAAAYDDGWSNADNPGDDFTNWVLWLDGAPAGHFVQSSTGNGDGDGNADGDIDTGGRAWGLYASGGATAHAVRPFTSPLPTGGQVLVRMDNGYVIPGGTVGFTLQNANYEDLIDFYFLGGDSFYTVSDTATTATTIGWTDEGLEILVTNQGSGTCDIKITSLNGGATQTLAGRTLKSPGAGQAISQIRLFNDDGGVGSGNDVFFNTVKFSAVGGLPVELDVFTVE